MKTNLFSLSKKWLAASAFAGMLFTSGNLIAQTRTRTYANFQGSLATGTSSTNIFNGQVTYSVGSISSDALAVNGNPKDSSTLSLSGALLTGSGITQFLEFTNDGTNNTPVSIAANTPIYLKLSIIGTNLTTLLSGVTIGTFSGLHTVAANPGTLGLGANTAGYDATTKNALTQSTITNLLGNQDGTYTLTITPTVACNGVYVSISNALISGGMSTSLFDAYYYNTISASAGTPKPVDITSGAITGVSIGSTSVDGNWNAIDGDDNTAALLTSSSSLASIGTSQYITAYLDNPAQAGDSMYVVVQDPGGLLDVSLLSGFTLQAYNGDVAVGDAVSAGNSLVGLKLLQGAGDKAVFSVAVPSGSFDRITLSYGSLANIPLLGNGTLNVYEMGVTIPAPIIAPNPQTVYSGGDVLLSASTTNGDDVKWVNAAGDTLANNTTVQADLVTAPTSLAFKAFAVRGGSTSNSAPGTLTVNDLPIGGTMNTPAAGVVGTPYSSNVSIIAAGGTTPVSGYVYSISSTDVAALAAQNLVLNPDGTITSSDGTAPTSVVSIPFTVHVVDANGLTVGDFPVTLDISAALAITLQPGSFKASLDNGKNVLLQWTTLTEINEDKFDVQSSTDGVHFTTIGSVKAAGTSSTPKSYKYTDNGAAGLTYYRLAEADNAGHIVNSDVINIDNGKQAQVTISPNPTTTYINISGSVSAATIYDAGGRLVLTSVKQTQINVSKLLPGIYFITIQQKDGSLVKSKFIKR